MTESPQMMILGPVDAVGTAESRITHQDPDHEGGLVQPTKHRPWPLVYVNLTYTTTSSMPIVDSIVKIVSHVGIWTFSAE